MVSRSLQLAALIATALLGVAISTPGLAHDLALTDGTLVLRTDRSWQLDLIVDLDALALGAGPNAPADRLAAQLAALPAAEQAAAVLRAEGTLRRRVRVLVDGEPVEARLGFPERGLGESGGRPSFLGLTARFEGQLPPAAATISVKLSRGLPALVLTTLDALALRGGREAVEHGGASAPWSIGEPLEAPPPPVLTRYLGLGILHIVPRGLDHILFVLGLFLVAGRIGPLLWQVSAFTLAHTLSLALAATGVLVLPSRPVEVAIALSIAWIGVVALRRAVGGLDGERSVGAVLVAIFACGLLHGLGFAGVLDGIGLPSGELIPALIGFNLGVELGQIAVLLGALALLGPWRGRPWYRQRLVAPLAVGVALAGAWWTIERALG